MEHASHLHSVSSSENGSGLKLRKGQERLRDYIEKNPGESLVNVQFPTGYGKTVAFAVAYNEYRSMQIVNRAVVVVPTTTQRIQYEKDFGAACAKVGIDGGGKVKRIDCDTATLRYHKNNMADVFVIGVGKLIQNLGYMRDLMAKGKWLLVADEHHHYAPDMPWGDAVRELMEMSERTLAMSATPYRNGGDLSIFGRPTDGLRITLKEASDEHAIKRIKANIEHYFVDVVDRHGEVTRITTESLRNGDTLPESLSAWETKQQLRYLNKYLSPMMSSSVACLSRKQIEHPGQHQMIVYAMSCRHAQSLAQAVKTIGLGEVSVDWVGVGPDGRGDEENDGVLGRFKSGEIDCLVQVNKAGEGFDVCRASVLVFLNLLGSSPQAEQQIGRGLRRNYAIKDHRQDVCDIFVPADSHLVDLVRGMEQMTQPEDEEQEEKDKRDPLDPSDFRLESLPSWQLLSAEHDRSEVLWVIDPNDPRVYRTAKEMEPVYKAKGRPFSAESKDDLEQVAKAMALLMKEQHAAQSEDERLKQARDRVFKAVNVCANNLAKLRARITGGSYERSLVGDLAKKIHGTWKRQFGGHSDMTIGELEQKYDWVDSINNSVRAGEVPEWLII